MKCLIGKPNRIAKESETLIEVILTSKKNKFLCASNLVPRSHSVIGNVRFGKVRQYTMFHWLLKKGRGNAIYALIGLFRGALQ